MTTQYKSPPIGQEISCVMHGISKKILSSNEDLKKILLDSLKKCNFGILKSINHSFTPQGYTALILLSESHLAVHTYPEYNSIYFSLYSCRGPEDAEKTFKLVKEKLNAKKFLFLKKNKIPIMTKLE